MIAIGSDHGGFALKEFICNYLEQKGLEIKDFGCFSEESVDYAPIAAQVAKMVASKQAERGILICSTGLGICMVANKVKGIRAAVCSDLYSAEMTRRHNDANILCMGGKIVNESKAAELVDIFLSTEFEGGRHQRRVDQIAQIENEE
ncbi:ribose 5-phosphate isomerase B [Scatolibacter rhodanostii]|uniref:ribose 5-phosphate isomerase B n=1 Tax=Scatolibacter rhodanostii TaxID=2014781 RepID=UPI000C068A55|nr:ribose 5-phosphate isomerase B [Scatolibacter rhodanostii]